MFSKHPELRRNAPLPADCDFVTVPFLGMFMDNLDGCAFDQVQEKEEMQEYKLQARKTGERCGIIYDEGEKQVSEANQTKTLRAEIRSAPQGARPLGKRRADICDMTFFLMNCDPPAIKHVEMAGGVWIHIAQYKRQLMS